MKKIRKIMALSLALVMAVSLLAACGGDKGGDDTKKVYAVEAGSAGEAVAKENGWEYNSVDDMSKALMEVEAGTSDAAIIDLLMAGAMIGEGTSYPNMAVTDSLVDEFYGIGCRKDSDLVGVINQVLYEAYTDGTMAQLAEKYKVRTDTLVEQKNVEKPVIADDGDVAYIKDKGELVVGTTIFAPMDFYAEDGKEMIGFDADLAKLVADKLGVKIRFQVIDWNNKIFEVEGKGVDVLWNGMTLTDEVTNALSCTNSYCKNAQVVVENTASAE